MLDVIGLVDKSAPDFHLAEENSLSRSKDRVCAVYLVPFDLFNLLQVLTDFCHDPVSFGVLVMVFTHSTQDRDSRNHNAKKIQR